MLMCGRRVTYLECSWALGWFSDEPIIDSPLNSMTLLTPDS